MKVLNSNKNGDKTGIKAQGIDGLDKGFYVLLCQKDSPTSIQVRKKGHIIRDNGTLLPYLSIKQQLFSSISFRRRKEYSTILKKWWTYFRLDKDFLEETPEELSPEQLLLINFIHSVAQKKKVIAFEDSKQIIIKQFWLDLFPALEKIAAEEQLTIILLTSNKEIAYMAQYTAFE